MDLATLDTRAGANAGFDVELKHPDSGDPIGAVIRVYGADSDAYKDKQLTQQRERLEKLARKGRVQPPTPEQLEQQSIELLAAATDGWQGLEIGGKPVEFNRAAAVQLYGDYPWIREQVDAAIHDRANFLPRSASS